MSCVNAIHFCPSSQISRRTTFAATWTTSTFSGRASGCVLWWSLHALNFITDNWCQVSRGSNLKHLTGSRPYCTLLRLLMYQLIQWLTQDFSLKRGPKGKSGEMVFLERGVARGSGRALSDPQSASSLKLVQTVSRSTWNRLLVFCLTNGENSWVCDWNDHMTSRWSMS